MVRSTVLRKSRPSLPLVIPIHIARNVAIGDGSSTGSTTRAQTVSDQTASSTATPTKGSNDCRRFIALSSFANFALEHFKTMRLDADEVSFRHRLERTWTRRVVMHEFHRARGMARQQQDSIRQIYCFLQVVRHQYRGRCCLDENTLELLPHQPRHFIVQRRKRLVKKQDFRFHNQCPHDRDQLLLSPGQLIWIKPEIDLDAEIGDEAVDPPGALPVRYPHQLQGIWDIVESPQPSEPGFTII